MGFLERFLGRRSAEKDGGETKGKGEPLPTTEQPSAVELNPDELRRIHDAEFRIGTLRGEMKENMLKIARRCLRDVPTLREQFENMKRLHVEAENGYSTLGVDASRSPEAQTFMDSIRRNIADLRRYAQELDRVEAAYRAYEIGTITHRTGGEIEYRSGDFRTRGANEWKDRDYAAGGRLLQEFLQS